MTIAFLRALPLATILIAAAATPAFAATASPSPAPSRQPKQVIIQQPTVPLHGEYLVKVNKKGQVVASHPVVQTKSNAVNTMMFGNTLQMWIRKPDGTAEVGTYKVSYDYDPKTHKIKRNIALVSLGGDWGDKPGAASVMIETAEREAQEAQKKQQEQNKNLPSLNQITGKSPAPSPSPHP